MERAGVRHLCGKVHLSTGCSQFPGKASSTPIDHILFHQGNRVQAIPVEIRLYIN